MNRIDKKELKFINDNNSKFMIDFEKNIRNEVDINNEIDLLFYFESLHDSFEYYSYSPLYSIEENSHEIKINMNYGLNHSFTRLLFFYNSYIIFNNISANNKNSLEIKMILVITDFEEKNYVKSLNNRLIFKDYFFDLMEMERKDFKSIINKLYISIVYNS